MTTEEILLQAKEARPEAAVLTEEVKNSALLSMASALENAIPTILAANEKDLIAVRGSVSDVMLDRLSLNEKRIHAMVQGIRDVATLEDPVGRILEDRITADGLHLIKKSVPIGVVAIIYESRPNVTSDAAALCLKSGNVCVLRGGKEAYASSHAILHAMRLGLRKVGLNEHLINMLEDTTHEGAGKLMRANGFVDVLIPRGGAGLIRACVQNATVPCIETGTGICTVYVDKDADPEKALKIIVNAKTQRPSVCNAEEVCLVHESVAAQFLPMLKRALVDERPEAPVELRLCEKSLALIDGTPAAERDFDTEFLDYILAVKIVRSAEEAVKHIGIHSTHHSDAIVTENRQTADYFTANVDSAAVYVNASTRFTDGGCFGLGCEMGISTQKLHARGPMGLRELTSYKYIITGEGQVRK